MKTVAAEIGAHAQRQGLWVAVAESLTGGLLVSELAAAPEAGRWMCGGVVAYSTKVKQELLGVTPGPVVTERAALEMAHGARQCLGSDAAVAVTGVGGPGSEEGQPAGTVWIAVVVGDASCAACFHFAGDPPEVCRQTCEHALQMLLDNLM